MSKKNKKKISSYKLGDGSIPAIITEHLSKKGRLKAADKKQMKVLVGSCVHHVINNKGKLKPTVSNNGKKECYCRVCRHSFSTVPYDEASVANIMDAFVGLNNQSKFVATAVGAGNETMRFFAEAGAIALVYKSRYTKLIKVAKKADGVRYKQKKKKTSSGASAYGSWT